MVAARADNVRKVQVGFLHRDRDLVTGYAPWSDSTSMANVVVCMIETRCCSVSAYRKQVGGAPGDSLQGYLLRRHFPQRGKSGPATTRVSEVRSFTCSSSGSVITISHSLVQPESSFTRRVYSPAASQ